MEDRNLELLFEYLRSILFDTPIQSLDLNTLEEPYQKLGKGMAFLQETVEELKAYSADLSMGTLSGKQPSKENYLCSNLKNIHANLNHLTWQATQVAQGDYSQRVSYLGAFSDAFNQMIQQLGEREAFLKKQAEEEKQRAEIAQGYNTLLSKLTNQRKAWLFVVDSESKKVLYCNKKNNIEEIGSQECLQCKFRLPFYNQILAWEDNGQSNVWEIECDEEMSSRITSFSLEWQGQKAFAHIVEDITAQARATRKLTAKAYRDSLTGVYNRSFFEEYMDGFLEKKHPMLLVYMDLDRLKAVNDKYGHHEGDRYIRKFVQTIQKHFRSYDILARIGGDEFVLLLENIPKETAISKLQQTMEEFEDCSDQQYRCGFSFGIVNMEGQESSSSLQELLQQADQAMYECKRKKKQQRS